MASQTKFDCSKILFSLALASMAGGGYPQYLVFESRHQLDLNTSPLQLLPTSPLVCPHKGLGFDDSDVDSLDRGLPVWSPQAQDAVHTGHVADRTPVARFHGRVQHRAFGQMLAKLLPGTTVASG